MKIIRYVSILIPLVLIDAVWLTTTSAQYKEWLGHLMAPQPNLLPAAVFYLLYAAGIYFFVISPAITKNQSLGKVFLTGAFLGIIAYGTYDLTNHATLMGWPYYVTLIDMMWGAVVTGLASLIGFALSRAFLRRSLTTHS